MSASYTGCRRATRRLGRALAIQAMLLLLGAASLAWPGAVPIATLLILGATWVAGGTALILNHQLVRCGPVRERAISAPGLINNPNPAVRLLLHLLVNWAALAFTAAVAWRIGDPDMSFVLAWITIVAAVAVSIAFNVLHRRMNRLRNLSLSTGAAGLLCLVCLPLVLP